VITDTNQEHDTNEVLNEYIYIFSESKALTGNQYQAGEYDEVLAEELQKRISLSTWKKFVAAELKANPAVPFHRLAEACISND